MMGCLKSGILAGVTLFIWGYVSWMMIPWHAMTYHSFKSDVAISQAIVANVPTSGIYVLPSMQQGQASGPMVFAAVNLSGMPASMTMPLVISLLTQILAAVLVALLLTKTNKLSYLGRVGFVLVVALVAIIIKDIPHWNWSGFDTQYTLVMMGDTLIGWFLAGLILAKCSK